MVRNNEVIHISYKNLTGKEVRDMAVIYATLIIKGRKKFSDVPDRIKDQVKEVLIDLDCGLS